MKKAPKLKKLAARYTAAIRRDLHKFEEEARRAGQTRKCRWCGKDVTSHGQGRPRLFCSEECRVEARRVYHRHYYAKKRT